MTDHKRLMLQNKRDAAVARRAKLLADIAAVESGKKSSRTVFLGESSVDARENHLGILRAILRDEELDIERMSEDLDRSAF